MALPQLIRKCWHKKSDLTIYDATFWMLFESDPEQHTYRCECDSEFETDYFENPNGSQALYETSEEILSAIRAKFIKITKKRQIGNGLDIKKTYILKSDWIKWCQQNDYIDLSNLFIQHIIAATPFLTNTHSPTAAVSNDTTQLINTTLRILGIKSTYKPFNAVGKMVVKAAELIEQENMKRASKKQVMELLQKWADEGTEPSTLKKSLKEKHSVMWLSEKGDEVIHSLEAVGKTLEKWKKGRH